MIQVNAPAADFASGILRHSTSETRNMFDFIRRMDDRMRLMGRMAAATGTPLPDAVAGGQLDAERLRSAAIRCTACTNAEACEDWLEGHAEGAREAPSYCRNRSLFARLAGGH
jgi:hypothetical protein